MSDTKYTWKVTTVTVGPFGFAMRIDPDFKPGLIRIQNLDGSGVEYDETTGTFRTLPSGPDNSEARIMQALKQLEG